MRYLRIIFLSLAIALFSRSAVGQTNSWAKLALQDLAAMKTQLEQNHPGAVDEQNPQFAKWVKEGYIEASELAKTAESPEGYYYALKRYADGFNDKHLNVSPSRDLKLENFFWPGFAVSLQGDRFTIADLSNLKSNNIVNAKQPQPGDILIGCDGKSADRIFSSNVLPFYGVEGLKSDNRTFAPFLMFDNNNPHIQRPTRCTFENKSSGKYDLNLNWQPIALNSMMAIWKNATGAFSRPEIGFKQLKPGVFWITLSTFSPNNVQTKQLQDVIQAAKENSKALQEAKVIVFDVRGNGGGSSQWGQTLLNSIWGNEFVTRLPGDDSKAVEWRASTDNILWAKQVKSQLAQQWQEDSTIITYLNDAIAGMEKALDRGDNYYHKPTGFISNELVIRPGEVKPKIYLLSDGACGSACLDFADWVLSIPNAELIGRETSADTEYGENRKVKLPSNKVNFAFPPKVYRGRVRGSNEPYKPTHQWNGNSWDTEELQNWVLKLSAQ